MRLVTRSDFDGLVCGALLLEAGIIDSWKFAHPKDLQDGLVEVTENDCLANVPFVPGCGLWFDHHSSEHERLALEGKYKGESRITPSCARIIYEYYGGKDRFPQYDEVMEAVDKVDSGNLTLDEILNPTGWILIGFLMDPRTGLHRLEPPGLQPLRGSPPLPRPGPARHQPIRGGIQPLSRLPFRLPLRLRPGG